MRSLSSFFVFFDWGLLLFGGTNLLLELFESVHGDSGDCGHTSSELESSTSKADLTAPAFPDAA